MEEAIRMLQELQGKHFWGAVQLDFQDGELTVIRKTETIKPLKRNYPDGKHSGNNR